MSRMRSSRWLDRRAQLAAPMAPGALRDSTIPMAWRWTARATFTLLISLTDTIRKITSGGVVSTLAGLAGNPGSADGTGSAARFNFPAGVAVDSAGNVYVADYVNSHHSQDHLWRGGDYAGWFSGRFWQRRWHRERCAILRSHGVAVDSAGNVYVADSGNHTIRKITSGGSGDYAGWFSGQSGQRRWHRERCAIQHSQWRGRGQRGQRLRC